uniref:Uncharacterized protein n=1 Tax=Tanacetum cinerariifolium TaxID=118510 RepID=A0A6L2KSN8_TANCI|nr:hypothetical protein [Tanacetum cinerariifolium]
MDRRSLITELRYKAVSSNWTDVLSYFCREAADEDRRIATKLNRLREEILIVCEKRRNHTDELRSIRGIVVVGKATEFVTDKYNAQVAQLREVESRMEFRAFEKEIMWTHVIATCKLAGFLCESSVDKSGIVKPYGCFLVSVLWIEVNTADWEPQFILYCQRAMGEDQRLAWQINALCDTLIDVIERKKNCVAELDMLVPKEFELRARKKDLFIEKLKVSYRSSIDIGAGIDVDDDVPAI